MDAKKSFSKEVLKIDNISKTVDDIIARLQKNVFEILRRKGGIIGISGGIDSSVTLALAARALGSDKVKGIMLPEKDSNPESKRLAIMLANKYNVQIIEENITDALEGFKCYQRRDDAVRKVFPEYNPQEDKMKIGITQTTNQYLPSVFSVTIINKEGISKQKLLPANEYMQIVAASNFKQRCRMAMLYYHAERLHYAVIGTPNKHEVEQGFFVKYGDGGADVMPIAHLFKTQVYQLAEFLEIPQEIIGRTPTTDTYTAEQTQEEFFYQLPFDEMDMIWYGFENGYDPSEVGSVMGKSEEDIKGIYHNFIRKQKTTEYLRMVPIKDF